MDTHGPKARPQIVEYFNRMNAKSRKTETALHPFSQVLLIALDEYSKTKNRTDIDKKGIMSMTMVGKLIKGVSSPQRLTPKLRAAIEFLGYDAEAAWIGKPVRIIPTTPPDPNDMLKKLLETDRAKTVLDMLSAIYRDEFSSVDG